MHRVASLAAVAAVAALAAGPSAAGGAPYTVVGGTPFERTQVRSALAASTFDWSLLPRPISVRIARGGGSWAIAGEVDLDADLLDAGRLSWGVVQHEFAHQVDFLLLDDGDRARLQAALGGRAWWPGRTLAHGDLASERFASTVAWAYWPSPDNLMRPDAPGGISTASFRALLRSLLQVSAASHG